MPIRPASAIPWLNACRSEAETLSYINRVQRQTYRTIAWTLYIFGFILIAGSWVRIVSPQVGWSGWLVGMAGWGMFQVGKLRRRTSAERLQDLDRMRQQGLVSDEEYVRQRDRIIQE